MTLERKGPDNSGFSREQLQRMRAEICGFVDRTPNVLNINPETHRYEIDVSSIGNRGYGPSFATLYRKQPELLVDDVLFYRFVMATNTYIDTPDDVTRRTMAEESLILYMEYLLNTPQTLEEKVMMEAVGFQPLDNVVKEKIVKNIVFVKDDTRSNPFPVPTLYKPTFSPEYKEYFLKFREEYLHAFEPDPTSKTPLRDELIEEAVKGFVQLMSVPQDLVRDLPVPQAEFIPEPEENLCPEFQGIRNQANSALAELEPTERRLMMLLFGLEDGIARTTAEAAKILGITMEEVKYLESKALSSMRKPDQG